MKKYMLDTNICIYLIKKCPPEIVKKFDNYRKGEIIISAITWAELCCGIKKEGRDTVENLLSVLDVEPFGIKQADKYGELTHFFPNRKANLDRMIAAHAISLNVTLVTNNIDDFCSYTRVGLSIENWVSSHK
ncbi:VapC toxin family PIN domain ribonuclease [Candidatus Williamhamiltonella defendens]|uniref:Addiction module, PIN domain protein n=3 Tax=Candidatus Williamhamiltonella defendens TaxID=138072 RepID=C3M8B5_HAMD5|nr:type II toxin-antitoxin system VapC family toxin [Candidatus Hamiltonella defensa]ACQ68710.1 addiction module, PIN domain protein [Candidatus Hamiltonella defensa 5AT (Acyrthosiphon pisum)]ACQ68886.1 putative addiction module, PIN domain protein [Candidatus Hamiltonella defensa 5AT (Acyrthosiphon pisum)]ATW23241.1 VapC toxin family PIN domain ribonuclease [Candidatus Hamiltonella defensa]ATW30459.1 VapC toxin family PIN domain ribonuclease [Candidatus Hamiltonella defensa]ATW32469.1 VapC to